ncbi:DUF362 domain-containing protein [Phosphitispora sp. TUW77]|uniref:DUF362 domain-containing protein n=1 Tax=Phosphitispora sp. TUW77 TaxID=3152361 RepID=UPI003AB32FBC
MVQVSVCRCGDYSQQRVNAAVHAAMELIGGMERFVRPGQKVLLKVNALTMRLPEEAVTTHPAVIRAVAAEVKKAGGIIQVGDSSGGIIAGQAPTTKTFEISGIARAAQEAGAELVNFDSAGIVPVAAEGPIQTLYLAKPVMEADVVISLPKLKTHSLTILTGAVKNMYGCVPGHRKSEYHGMAPRLKDFARVLVDIYGLTRPALTIMDGIIGMEGNGPSAGSPRNTGLVLAAEDGVALDAVVAHLVGVPPSKIHTTRIAHQRGLGIGDMSKIEVLGEKLETLKIKDFDLPSNSIFEVIPGFLVSGALGILKARPVIAEDVCVGCSLCMDSCPVQAMEMPGKYPVIDYNKCISCLCCQELCSRKAVRMKQVNRLGTVVAGIINYTKQRKRRCNL